MAEKTPAQVAAVERLRAWALGPEGQAHFRWGTEGSFDRAVSFYRRKGLPEHMVKGWVAKLYHEATGHWPGEHHDGEKGKG
jgi:hypothetical protein